MYKPKPETLACLGGSDDWMLQSGLFKVHWFVNAAQMQKHSWQVQGQIMVPALLKGKLLLHSQASSELWSPAPSCHG